MEVASKPILLLSDLGIDFSQQKVICNDQETKPTVTEYDLPYLLTVSKSRVFICIPSSYKRIEDLTPADCAKQAFQQLFIHGNHVQRLAVTDSSEREGLILEG